MSDSTNSSKERPTNESVGPDQPSSEAPVAASQPVHDRTELLTRARAFLFSPQVRLQDSDAKRTFLAEKGLTPSEIDQLLRELARHPLSGPSFYSFFSQPPSVPPRTYPALPPSNLPNLLIGAARILTWLAGASTIALFLYYRYLLPRLAQSYQARLALRKHQFALIARLTESASALKTAQTDAYKDLPRAVPVYEDPQYAQCHSIDDLLSYVATSQEEAAQSAADIPDITILRCALEELGRTKTDGTSTVELFRHLEGKLVWLGGEEGAARQSGLWNQLNACSIFVSTEPRSATLDPLPLNHPSRLLWKFVPPPLPTTSPLLASLDDLNAALARKDAEPASSLPIPTMSARQRTLQAFSDFTGYITAQTYTIGHSLTRGSSGDPVEDELRREIRALKGLVLNRRSFLPAVGGASGITSEPRGSV